MLALEIGAAFAVVLVRSVTGAQVAQVAQPMPAGDPVAQERVEAARDRKSAPARATKPKRRRNDDNDQVGPPKRGLAGLLDTVKANGGVIDMSQRKLARQLGQSRTTLQRTMRELSDAGLLALDTTTAGTRLALA